MYAKSPGNELREISLQISDRFKTARLSKRRKIRGLLKKSERDKICKTQD